MKSYALLLLSFFVWCPFVKAAETNKFYLTIDQPVAVSGLRVGADADNRTNTQPQIKLSDEWENGYIASIIGPKVWEQKVSELGLPQAQYWAGMRCLKGEGVPRDPTNAFIWLSKAANNNNSDAQYQVGLMYGAGLGVAQDYGQANSWYRIAASNENSNAQFALGINYGRAKGVPKDMTIAMQWFEKAANNGSVPAMSILGDSYFWGNGNKRDNHASLKWYERAAEMGEARAQASLAILFFLPSDLESNHVLAAYWLQHAANQWHLQAQFFLALCYAKGVGVEKDPIEAYKWSFLASRADQAMSWPPCGLAMIPFIRPADPFAPSGEKAGMRGHPLNQTPPPLHSNGYSFTRSALAAVINMPQEIVW